MEFGDFGIVNTLVLSVFLVLAIVVGVLAAFLPARRVTTSSTPSTTSEGAAGAGAGAYERSRPRG